MDMTSLKILLYVPDEAREEVLYRFREVPQVQACAGDPLASPADALIVPLNSFGFLDSGFALRVADRFGLRIQDELRLRIAQKHDGELLVGRAEIVPTGETRPAFVIAAPVGRALTSSLKDTVNVYLAMRGALIAVRDLADPSIQTIALPFMGVAEANLTPYAAARQIRYGIRAIIRDEPRRVQNLSKAIRREKDLKRQAKETDGEPEKD